MRKVSTLIAAATFSIVTASLTANADWTENWESYTSSTTPYGSWTLGNGAWMPLAGSGNALDNQAYHITGAGTSRIGRDLGFTATGMQTITLDGWFYDNNGASSSKRSWLGFQDNFNTDNALLRIGMNNLATYQVHYYDGSLKTIDTGVGNETGWHYVKLSMTQLTGGQWDIDWQVNKVDGTPSTGSFTWAWNAALANKVVVGYNYSSTTAIDWDNISLTAAAVPEPSTLALALLGGVGFLVLRRR